MIQSRKARAVVGDSSGVLSLFLARLCPEGYWWEQRSLQEMGGGVDYKLNQGVCVAVSFYTRDMSHLVLAPFVDSIEAI